MDNQINLFQKGIVADLDPMLVKNDQWVFPTLNVRFINKEGQGVIAVPLDSNTKTINGVIQGEAGEEFLIRNGYTIIGACDYNGIAYLVMVDPINGNGEIGCYPSPMAITSHNINTGVVSIQYPQVLTGFQREYRPLVNFTGPITNYNPVNRRAFNSTSFNFSTHNRVDMFAKPDYDGSVNLYLADSLNEIRHINTGFDQEGTLLTDRLYCDLDFGSKMNLMPATNSNMRIIPFGTPGGSYVDNYGTLKFGNYFFFFQYATKNFDTTEFVSQFGPIQVDDSGQTCNNSFGGKAINSSNKKIVFKLENLDITYPFIRVGYMRYYSDENNVPLNECVIVENYYSTTATEIIVTGSEASFQVNIASLIEGFPDERIPKSIDESEKRLFGGNWKTEDRNLEVLNDFFSKVELKWEDGQTPGDPHSENLLHGDPISNVFQTKDFSQNRDYRVTFNTTGYFREEAYPFALLAEFNNGSFSKAFLPRGIDSLTLTKNDVNDEYDGVVPAVHVNNKGFLRFPMTSISHPYIGNSDGHALYVLSVCFDFTKAFAWLAGQPPIIQNIVENTIRAIHFVRGDRFKNIRYQGITIAGCMAQGNSLTALYTDMVTLPEAWNPSDYDTWYNCFAPLQGGVYGNMDAPGWNYLGALGHGHEYSMGQPFYNYHGTDSWGNMFNNPKNLISGPPSFIGGDINWKYRKAIVPFFRGYAPMMWYRNDHSTGNYFNNDKCPEVNYATRHYCQPGKYGFFSPDFLIQPANDIDGIKHMHRTAKTMNATRVDPADPDSIIFKSATVYSRDGWKVESSLGTEKVMFPRGYKADVYQYWYSDGMLNPDQNFHHYWNDFKIEKIGEASSKTCQDALVGENRFINYSSDFITGISNCYFYAEKTAGRDHFIAARSFYIPKYISIDTTLDAYGEENGSGVITGTGAWSGNYNLDIVNLCNINPNDIDVNNIGDPLTIVYRKIGHDKTLDELRNESEKTYLFSGDCFLQRVYFKQIYWDGSGFGSSSDHEGWENVALDDDMYDNPYDDGNPVTALFTHGVILGVVFECAYNINMRIPGETSTFFPKVEAYDFAKKARNANGVESWIANNGYNVMVSDKPFMANDFIKPKTEQNYPTRIRHSDQYIVGAFSDNYRSIKQSYFKDYPTSAGEIVSVRDFSGTLFSVQERSINRHYVNQEQIKTEASTGELVIGIGAILSDKFHDLANYGSQHQFSVMKGERGIYGFDFKRRILWRATMGATQTGTPIAQSQMLSSEKMIETWLYDKFENNDVYSDIIDNFRDDTINGYGVHTGYDKKHNEVLFTFLHGSSIPVGENQGFTQNGNVLVFSEKLDSFTSEYSLKPAIYWNTNTELFSGLTTISPIHDMAFMHNLKESCLLFYGDLSEMQLSVIVNGGQEVGIVSEKEFLAYNVESTHNEFSESIYETKNQVSNRIPFVSANRFWANPEYLEHHWQCPVYIKTDADNNVFYEDSSMRGTWMKLTLVYRQSVRTFVKNIVSFFNSSHS